MCGTPREEPRVLDMGLARGIRLFGTDVDGVLTDNAVFIGEVADVRVEFKRFDVHDGLGITLLREVGIEMAWVSGRASAATLHRAAELKVTGVHQVPSTRKVEAIEAMLSKRGLSWSQMLFVGDDLPDVPVLRRVGLPIAVANARPEVKRLCHYVTTAPGGHGAIREVIEQLLRARGEWERAATHYLGPEGLA